jgi:hypothetical protein
MSQWMQLLCLDPGLSVLVSAIVAVIIMAAVTGLVTFLFTHLWPRLTMLTLGASGHLALRWPQVPLALAVLGGALALGVAIAALAQKFVAGNFDEKWWAWLLGGLAIAAPLYAGAHQLSPRGFHLLCLLLSASVAGGALGGFDDSAPPALLQAESRIGAHRYSAMWLGLGFVAALALYRQLAAINARRQPRTVNVLEVLDATGARRHDLERLLEEGFYKASFHSPSPLPGGPPLYWKRLSEEMKGEGHLASTIRTVGTFLHLTAIPHSLQVKGAIIKDTPRYNPGHEGLRIQVHDGHSGELVLSESFWGDSVHEAVELASYGIVATSFYRCSYLPEWVLWEDRDGKALRDYWRGCRALSEGRFRVGSTARKYLKRAVARSPGTAYATFQLAGLYELLGFQPRAKSPPSRARLPCLLRAIELYADLVARHPHLLLAWFRLATLFAHSSEWLPETDVVPEVLVRRLQHAVPVASLKGPRLQAVPFDTCTRKLHQQLLTLAAAILQWVQRALNWDVLLWSVTSLAERRWFSMTLGRPARERLALQRAVVASRIGVELRRLQAETSICNCLGPVARWYGMHARAQVHNDYRQRLRAWAQGSFTWDKVASGSDPQCKAHRQALCKQLRKLEALEREGARLSRRRGEWWGSLHYSLACCNAQALDVCRTHPRTDQTQVLAEDAWAERAVQFLRYASRDAMGPLAGPSQRWFEVDPELRTLRRTRRFTHWHSIHKRRLTAGT